MAPTILKLGGSIITRKYAGGEFNAVEAARLAHEIKQALEQQPQRLILIHGAGGKVHQLAKQFNLQNGAISPEQIRGSLLTHYAVRELTQQVIAALAEAELPIIPLPTSSIFGVKNGQPIVFGIELIQQALDKGLIPLLSGDMVLDDRANFSILSGDRIAVILAKEFNAQKIIFASDVDGLYDQDPKTNPQAKLIEQAELSSIDTTLTNESSIDTTNQMLGKIAALMKDESKIPVQILNGLVVGRLGQALTDQPVIGTIIE